MFLLEQQLAALEQRSQEERLAAARLHETEVARVRAECEAELVRLRAVAASSAEGLAAANTKDAAMQRERAAMQRDFADRVVIAERAERGAKLLKDEARAAAERWAAVRDLPRRVAEAAVECRAVGAAWAAVKAALSPSDWDVCSTRATATAAGLRREPLLAEELTGRG
jgi:hypothetical protein